MATLKHLVVTVILKSRNGFTQALDGRNEILLRNPPHFTGSHAEDPKAFILEFDKAAKANSWNIMGRCMEILPSYFTGLAEDWFQELMHQKPVYSTFLTDSSAPETIPHSRSAFENSAHVVLLVVKYF
jgi:hypothetical protein